MTGTEFESSRTIETANGAEPRLERMPVDRMKRVVENLRTFSDAELSSIPVVHQGDHLERGATYVDLRHQERGEIVAMANMIADIDNWFVPKSSVAPAMWERLTAG